MVNPLNKEEVLSIDEKRAFEIKKIKGNVAWIRYENDDVLTPVSFKSLKESDLNFS